MDAAAAPDPSLVASAPAKPRASRAKAAASQPATPKPTAAKRTAAKPATPKPTAPKAPAPKAATPQPAAPKPAAPKPAAAGAAKGRTARGADPEAETGATRASPAEVPESAAAPAAAAARPASAARKAQSQRPAPKRTEFDDESLAAIRQALNEQRAELVQQLSVMEETALGLSPTEMSGEVSFDEDSADAGSFTLERDMDLSIANNVTDLRSKIDRALHQIEEGSYGICVSCGQPIEGPRLKALPHVTLCLKCKKLEERR